ncbi:MAG: TonB-dependent receptor [Pseudomonadales bacterium]|nr:TonB-dependent receptor [Pseudomonadales bacterium]
MGFRERLTTTAAVFVALGVTTFHAPPASGAQSIEEVVVVGTRRDGRSAEDSPVPVDVLGGDEFVRQGNTDMDDLLRMLIPSYNVNAQPISDAATLIRPAKLRGLPPDSTLVLVNGKRRHRSAVIAFLGDGTADGSQGPDISVIPGIALKQVEVLRDGAAAQYGSDAIAGVINFVLRDNAEGGTVEARYGEFYEGDGDSMQLAANVGFPLTDTGFANFSAEVKQVDPTSRSVQRGDAAALIAAGNTNVLNPVQVWGSPEIKDDFKLFGNLGLDLGNGSEAYAFGNWAQRTVEGGFFYRNPNTRDGVFSADGGNTILVANLDPTAGACPVVPIVNDVPDPTALAAVAAQANCFAFNQIFPGGFTPQFGGDIDDASITGGVRGTLANGVNYDVSASVGRSEVSFFITNTVNPNLASLQENIPTSYQPGAYIQTDRMMNLDLSYPIEVAGFHSPLNIAGGIEFRKEIFEIRNGDANSFAIDPNLSEQGFGIGSNGFPGFQPQDAGKNDRGSIGAYLDLEADVTEQFLLGVAVRYEDYDDFGDTLNGKIAGRFQVTDTFAVRAAASTGFRAPTVGQANVRNVTTAFTDGELRDEATLPPTNPVAIQLGATPLDPEESVNLAFGFVFNVGDLAVTLDYFNIEVKDRIALTSTLPLSDADRAALLAAGVTDALSISGARFFTNDFDTTTQGIDLVATYPTELFGGATEFSFVANWTKTEVDSFNPDIIGPTRVRQLEESLPEKRFALTANHAQGPVNGMVRVSWYDEYFEAHLDDGTLPIDGDAAFIVDVELGYDFNENFSVVGGAQNLFNEKGTKNPWADIVGAKYAPISPFGFNGGFWYVRGLYNF